MLLLRRVAVLTVGFSAVGTAAAAQSKQRSWDELAAAYDAKLEPEERRMGLRKLRQELFDAGVRGDVLEVGAGSGRNVAFVQPLLETGAVKSVVFVDSSGQMVAELNRKLTSPELQARATSLVCDATELPFDDESFDSVLSTFTLCSVDRPLSELHHAARVLKRNGRIFMLEHGRSTWCLPLNWYVDAMADTHERNWGCRFNRDIEKLVADVLREERLELVRYETRHFGTTHMIVLKKKTA
jgi:methyltransferase OMS1, mitochondrial